MVDLKFYIRMWMDLFLFVILFLVKGDLCLVDCVCDVVRFFDYV